MDAADLKVSNKCKSWCLQVQSLFVPCIFAWMGMVCERAVTGRCAKAATSCRWFDGILALICWRRDRESKARARIVENHVPGFFIMCCADAVLLIHICAILWFARRTDVAAFSCFRMSWGSGRQRSRRFMGESGFSSLDASLVCNDFRHPHDTAHQKHVQPTRLDMQELGKELGKTQLNPFDIEGPYDKCKDAAFRRGHRAEAGRWMRM